jgi:uroporphyrinogen-III synthase
MTRVWVTRVEGENGELATELRQCGLMAVVEPVLEMHLVHTTLDDVAQLHPDDWLVLTSPFAIRSVAPVIASNQRIAVIGQSSATLAQSLGLIVQLVSPTTNANGLWKHLACQEPRRNICFPRSSLASIPRIDGLHIHAPVLYSVVPRDFDLKVVSRSDVVTFTSSSAVLSVMKRLEKLEIPAVSIGPSTSLVLRHKGVAALVEAEKRTLHSVAIAVRDKLFFYGL